MDVPRDSGSLTRTFPSPFHMSSLLYRFGLSTRLCLPFCLMLTPFVSSTRPQTRYSWTLTCTVTRLPFTLVCTCISQSDIYMVGDGDSSLIFNLLCNHPTSVTSEIPRTLLVPSSSLAKATCFAFLRSLSPLSTHLPVVKSSLRVYFGTLITVLFPRCGCEEKQSCLLLCR